jgi:pimeloyl-ACP methyl ester carboxylesterase
VHAGGYQTGRSSDQGASFIIMEQLGHFPMSENPEQFGRYIAPVLKEILRQSSSDQQGVHG